MIVQRYSIPLTFVCLVLWVSICDSREDNNNNQEITQNSSSIVISSNGRNIRFLDGLNAPPTFRDPKAEEKYFNNETEIYFQHVTVKEFDKTSLECDLVGNPKPTIQWFKESNYVKDNRELIGRDDKELKMYISNSDDGALIICTGHNANGHLEKHFKLQLQRKERPKTEVLVAPQGLVKLDCRGLAGGNPNNRVVWTKGSDVLPESPHYILMNNGLTLKIVNAGDDQRDTYMCIWQASKPVQVWKFDVKLIKISQWTEWSKFTACDCDSLLQFRSRECIDDQGVVVDDYPVRHGCTGADTESQSCSCVVDTDE